MRPLAAGNGREDHQKLFSVHQIYFTAAARRIISHNKDLKNEAFEMQSSLRISDRGAGGREALKGPEN